MKKDFVVSSSPDAVAGVIIKRITQGKTLPLIDTPGVLLDDHRVECPSGTLISLVFTKYYARVGSFVTLVVTISDLLGQTVVHLTTGGHKLWDHEPDVDLGASSSFVRKVEEALKGHLISQTK